MKKKKKERIYLYLLILDFFSFFSIEVLHVFIAFLRTFMSKKNINLCLYLSEPPTADDTTW